MDIKQLPPLPVCQREAGCGRVFRACSLRALLLLFFLIFQSSHSCVEISHLSAGFTAVQLVPLPIGSCSEMTHTSSHFFLSVGLFSLFSNEVVTLQRRVGGADTDGSSTEAPFEHWSESDPAAGSTNRWLLWINARRYCIQEEAFQSTFTTYLICHKDLKTQLVPTSFSNNP